MAKLFKDRTDNDIKNKWYSMKRKDERNGTKEYKNPFADTNIVGNPLTLEVDYRFSSLDRKSTAQCLPSTADLKSVSSGCNDNTKGASATCTTDDNVTAV